jgi:hypothetical protein
MVRRVFTEAGFPRSGFSPNAHRGGFSPNALKGWAFTEYLYILNIYIYTKYMEDVGHVSYVWLKLFSNIDEKMMLGTESVWILFH